MKSHSLGLNRVVDRGIYSQFGVLEDDDLEVEAPLPRSLCRFSLPEKLMMKRSVLQQIIRTYSKSKFWRTGSINWTIQASCYWIKANFIDREVCHKESVKCPLVLSFTFMHLTAFCGLGCIQGYSGTKEPKLKIIFFSKSSSDQAQTSVRYTWTLLRIVNTVLFSVCLFVCFLGGGPRFYVRQVTDAIHDDSNFSCFLRHCLSNVFLCVIKAPIGH